MVQPTVDVCGLGEGSPSKMMSTVEFFIRIAAIVSVIKLPCVEVPGTAEQ